VRCPGCDGPDFDPAPARAAGQGGPVSSRPSGGTHIHRIHRIPDPKCCNDDEHVQELAAHGVAFTTHCPICAWELGSTIKPPPPSTIIHDYAERMKVWILEVAAVSPEDAEAIARIATEDPKFFRSLWALSVMRGHEDRMECIKGKLLDVYLDLAQMSRELYDRGNHLHALGASRLADTAAEVVAALDEVIG
jgi:hypothetical protein